MDPLNVLLLKKRAILLFKDKISDQLVVNP
jgi:hypothetical protein